MSSLGSVRFDCYKLAYQFTLENFEQMMIFCDPGESVESPPLQDQMDPGVSYIVHVFPSGTEPEKKGYTAVYLALQCDQSGITRRVRCVVKLLNKNNKPVSEKILERCTLTEETDWGDSRFRSRSEMRDYLREHGPNVRILVEMEAWRGTKSMKEANGVTKTVSPKKAAMLSRSVSITSVDDTYAHAIGNQRASIAFDSNLIETGKGGAFGDYLTMPRQRRSLARKSFDDTSLDSIDRRLSVALDNSLHFGTTNGHHTNGNGLLHDHHQSAPKSRLSVARTKFESFL